jgi:hypothetical protein
MRITQVFASADDERVISELEISPDHATSVPVAGDRVRWVVNDRIYTGALSQGSSPTVRRTILGLKARMKWTCEQSSACSWTTN